MDSQTAANTAPAEIVPCHHRSETYVRVNLAEAVRWTLKAQYRLVSVACGATEADRQSLWNSGPEKTWFEAYDARKLSRLRDTFDRIGEILTSPKLKVVCDPRLGSYAISLPGIRAIRLGRLWLDSDPAERGERIQTFIHEAAHIAGRFVAKESPWYGQSGAQAMAQKMQGKRPLMVTRSAENYGYYAMEVAANFGVYLWS